MRAVDGAVFPSSSPAVPFVDPQGPYFRVRSWLWRAQGLGPEESLGVLGQPSPSTPQFRVCPP